MHVNIKDLKNASDKLFEQLLESGLHDLTLTHDYYWEIPKQSRIDPYTTPTEFTMGQLSFDIAEMKRLIDGTAEPIPYALVWLAAILREIGEKTAE